MRDTLTKHSLSLPSKDLCKCQGLGVWIRLFSCRGNSIQSNFDGSNTFVTMKISSRQGSFEPMGVDNSARSGGIKRISLIFYNMKVSCVFSLESPQRGVSNEYTQYTVFNIKKENHTKFPKSAAKGLFPRDSRSSLKQPW